MTDNEILNLSVDKLFDRDFIFSLYDETEIEKERLIALCTIRAKELDVEKPFAKTIKACDKKQRELNEIYQKELSTATMPLQLETDAKGNVITSIDNFLKILRNDVYFKNVKYNLFACTPETEQDGKTVRWTDTHSAEARHYIETKYHIHSAPKCNDALQIIFSERSYNPVVDAIDALTWDGTPRITECLTKWMKCEDTPYTREVSRLIFAGGINRIYDPGCKFDVMPVLIGKRQGEGKSTFIRWLALNDLFFTEITEIEGAKSVEALDGAWICEVSELLALSKAREVEAVKSFITRQKDKIRRPYQEYVTEKKRQCIFIGTTNKQQFLTDKTGNRRFFPITVGQCGYDLFTHESEIKKYIKQCWAEARELYKRGNLSPVPDRTLIDDFAAHQREVVEDDYRVGLINDYLDGRDEVCIIQIWQEALDNKFSKPTKKDSNEIGLILQSNMDFERQPTAKRFPIYGLQKYWKRVGTTNGEITAEDADDILEIF